MKTEHNYLSLFMMLMRKVMRLSLGIICISGFILLHSCEIADSEDPDDDDTLEQSDFAAKWIVDSETKMAFTKSTVANHVTNATKSTSAINSSKNLAFDLWEGWEESIVISNQYYESDEYDDILDDDIVAGEAAYCNFSFTNDGSGDITTEFYAAIYIDDELYIEEEFDFGDVLSGYTWVWGGFELDGLTEGTHTVKVVLDSEDDISESDETDNEYEKSFIVLPAENTYTSFEFLESRYIITEEDGDVLYGELSTNSDKSVLYLDDFGTITITSISDSDITFELTTETKSTSEDITISATRSDEIESTEMVKMLTNDKWILTATTGADEVGEEWIISRAGTYSFHYDGDTYIKYWDYKDEESFYYGSTSSASDGTAYITDISNSELHIEDTAGNTYDFER